MKRERWRTVGVSALFAAATFVLVFTVSRWLRDDELDRAEPRDGEVSVVDAIAAERDQELAVRGFVFIDESTGMLLCAERSTGARPACKGQTLSLQGLDPSRLALEVADEKSGGFDAWSEEDVVLLGTNLGGSAFVVKDVLPS